VFTARYGLIPYIKQNTFSLKRLIEQPITIWHWWLRRRPKLFITWWFLFRHFW